MTIDPHGLTRGRLNWKLISLMILSVGIVAIILANVHLIYVAVESQPDCVPHAKQAGGNGTYRAARSAC